MQETEEPFVLAKVRAVCRHWPSVEALPHAVHLIHAFIENISPRALTNLLEYGDSSRFFQVLQSVEESENLVHHEKLRQYRLAMHLIPSKMTLKQGKLEAMKALYKRYRGSVDARTVQAIAEAPEVPVLKWLHSCQPKMFKIFPWCEKKIFDFASLTGRADVVRWLVKLFPDPVRSLTVAAREGHLGLIKWLMKNTNWDTELEGAFYAAVNSGHLGIAKLLYQNKPTMRQSYWSLESLEMVQWLYEIKFWDFTDGLLHCAAKRGHLAMVQWLHLNYSKLFTTDVMDFAAEYGRLELVKFLHANRSEGCTTKAMNSAARKGHLDVVQWLHENRSEGCTTDAMDSAAESGHLDVLKWLHSNRSEGCTSRALQISFYTRSPRYCAVVKWLHVNRGLKLPDEFTNRAARQGNLELLSWLFVTGKGKWSKETMGEAASHGHLEVVKFLHKHRRGGCTRSAMIKAAQNNHLNVVKWLRANRRKASTVAAMNAAATCGCLQVVKWLHENGQGGCAVSAMTNAASCGYLNVVKFLAANYSLEWSEKAMASAQSGGYTETVKWLYFHLGMKLLPEFAVSAARSGNIRLLEFLNKETDFCRNSTVFFTGDGNKHPEVVEWYKDHYGNPRKRKWS